VLTYISASFIVRLSLRLGCGSPRQSAMIQKTSKGSFLILPHFLKLPASTSLWVFNATLLLLTSDLSTTKIYPPKFQRKVQQDTTRCVIRRKSSIPSVVDDFSPPLKTHGQYPHLNFPQRQHWVSSSSDLLIIISYDIRGNHHHTSACV
jgi:hypothetical protein